MDPTPPHPTPRTGGCSVRHDRTLPSRADGVGSRRDRCVPPCRRSSPGARSPHRATPGLCASRTVARSRTSFLAHPDARAAMSTAAAASDAPSADVLHGLVHTDPQRCPPGCIILWIQAPRASRPHLETPEVRFVHSVWVELSTVIHRTPVGCDIRVIWGATIAHTTQWLATNAAVPRVYPRRVVETVRRAQSVDGTRSHPLCTHLWITVDDPPYGVDDEVPSGGRRVGTDRSPTGRATFPQRDHGFVHTHFCPLTCADTRFPRIPQPL